MKLSQLRTLAGRYSPSRSLSEWVERRLPGYSVYCGNDSVVSKVESTASVGALLVSPSMRAVSFLPEGERTVQCGYDWLGRNAGYQEGWFGFSRHDGIVRTYMRDSSETWKESLRVAVEIGFVASNDLIEIVDLGQSRQMTVDHALQAEDPASMVTGLNSDASRLVQAIERSVKANEEDASVNGAMIEDVRTIREVFSKIVPLTKEGRFDTASVILFDHFSTLDRQSVALVRRQVNEASSHLLAASNAARSGSVTRYRASVSFFNEALRAMARNIPEASHEIFGDEGFASVLDTIATS